MTEPSSILDTIFGEHDFEPPSCGCCAGVGLVGIGGDEMPALCEQCGGSGCGNVFDPNFLARFREPLTDAELDEAAAEFGAALLDGLLDIERRLETGDLPSLPHAGPRR